MDGSTLFSQTPISSSANLSTAAKTVSTCGFFSRACWTISLHRRLRSTTLDRLTEIVIHTHWRGYRNNNSDNMSWKAKTYSERIFKNMVTYLQNLVSCRARMADSRNKLRKAAIKLIRRNFGNCLSHSSVHFFDCFVHLFVEFLLFRRSRSARWHISLILNKELKIKC